MKIFFKFIAMLAIALIINTGSSNSFAQEKINYTEVSNFTTVIGENYAEAYFNMDFDKMAIFMHEDFNFLDPTATLVFGWSNPKGIDSAVNFFKTNYSSLLEMNPTFTRKFFSGETAMFEMNLKFNFKVDEDTININMPLVTVLTLKDGKVIEHRDYGDYNVYLKQYNEQMEALKK